MAIKGLLDAYMALGDSIYLHNAIATARLVEKNMLQSNGNLWRSYSGGKASTAAFLEDYAYLCDAFIQLYQSTFDLHWLLLSRQLAELSIKYFYDGKASGLFFSTDQSEESRIRNIPLEDNSMPSPNAVMGKVLYGLSVYFQNDSYLEKSRAMLARLSKTLAKKDAVYYSSWCCLAGLFAYGTNEVVIIGPDAHNKNLQIRKNYFPRAIFMGSTGDENLPLLEGRKSGNKTLIYVCTNKTCRMPQEEPAKAAEILIIK